MAAALPLRRCVPQLPLGPSTPTPSPWRGGGSTSPLCCIAVCPVNVSARCGHGLLACMDYVEMAPAVSDVVYVKVVVLMPC